MRKVTLDNEETILICVSSNNFLTIRYFRSGVVENNDYICYVFGVPRGIPGADIRKDVTLRFVFGQLKLRNFHNSAKELRNSNVCFV